HSSRFLSADQPNLGVVRVTVRCDQDADITVCTGIDANIWDLNGPHLEDVVLGRKEDVLSVHGRTHEAGKRVAVAEAVASPWREGEPQREDGRNLRRFSFRAQAGKEYSFEKYFAVFTDHDRITVSPEQAAIDLVRRA